MSFNYRCTSASCRKRTTKPKLLEQYVQERYTVCAVCGGRLSHDPEVRRRSKKQKCVCDGLPYPHRRGTFGCAHDERERTDEWYEEYYSVR